MSKIANVLKDEISRLAKKETTSGTKVLRKASAQYRRDIAQLKRTVDQLSKQVAFLAQQERRRVAEDAPAGKAEGRRFSARGLKTHREKLGLSAADYARLVGVTGQTIYAWEQGKSRPRDQQLASLVSVRSLGKREALRRLELLEG
jgi:DNA-binding transcriptional regulator YiaG